MNFVLRAYAADNDDGDVDVDDDGDDEGHVEALVGHLWNLWCLSAHGKAKSLHMSINIGHNNVSGRVIKSRHSVPGTSTHQMHIHLN